LSQTQIKMADVSVQTLSKMGTYDDLTRATSVIIDTTKSIYGIPEFIRVGNPELCGLGESNFILTAWKRK
jgi:hypothetical protein